MKVEELLDRHGEDYDCISAFDSESPGWQEFLRDDFVKIQHIIKIDAAQRRPNTLTPYEFDVHIQWAQGADIVFWESPPRTIHPRSVLFTSLREFAQWLSWRMRAIFVLTPQEVEVIQIELESLKIKIIAPSRLDQEAADAAPMTSDIELL